MSINSKIEWTHHTANLWHGCTKVHEGCDHCYAETLSKRWKRDIWGNDKPRMEVKSIWDDLKKAQAMAFASCEVQRVFVGSMMDIFEKPMPLVDSKGIPLATTDGSHVMTSSLRDRLFEEITDHKYPNLLFLFLTKRPSNINKYIPESWKTKPPENVMFGTSPVNQATADKLIPQLLEVKGKRFLSIEPMLGPIDLKLPHKWWDEDKERCDHCCNGDRCDDPSHYYRKNCPYCKGTGNGRPIHWIIVGGESGNTSDIRPMHPDWVRSVHDQCSSANVPFFFKQWGEWFPKDLINQDDIVANKAYTVKHRNDGKWVRLGKKLAGRLLDGKEYNEFPR